MIVVAIIGTIGLIYIIYGHMPRLTDFECFVVVDWFPYINLDTVPFCHTANCPVIYTIATATLSLVIYIRFKTAS